VAVDVDLEMEVAADRDRVTGLAHRADPLTGEDALTAAHEGPVRHMGVEVAAVLAFAVDQDVVAVENRVIPRAQDPAVANGDQRRPAGGDDVEAFVAAAAAAWRAEFADRAAGPVRALDREDVAVVLDTAIAMGDPGGSGCGKDRKQEEGEEDRALQWCSMTRSTMLYSFASSALMK
jgi:hypothetical protein